MKGNFQLSPKLLAWAQTLHRPMPWRGESDPYRIWLSEVILQQTRVAQGEAYYLRFLEAFPDVGALAAAEEREVLALWQGLGYYSRARNLHRAAQFVVNDLGGQFPLNYADLLALPGVGPYSAAAIASFAYSEAVAVVDGNVYRVLARLFGIDAPINKPAGQRVFRALADKQLDRQQPGTYNQALMDFGATVCTPKAPACVACTFRQNCSALAEGRVKDLPVKLGKTKRRARYFNYLCVRDAHDRVLLRERGAGDIWQGLYDFPLLESEKGFAERPLAETAHPWLKHGAAQFVGRSTAPKHVLSHQDIHARFYSYKLKDAEQLVLPEGYHWSSREQLRDYGLPRLIDRYLNEQTLDAQTELGL